MWDKDELRCCGHHELGKFQSDNAQLPNRPADSLDDAKKELHKAAESFAAQVEKLTPEAENRILHTSYGEFSVAQFAKVDLLVLIHHGQIAYIQTLCGDTESHFVADDF